MTDIYAQPDDLGEPTASSLHTGLGESLAAQASEAFLGGSKMLGRLGNYAQAEGDGTPIGGFAHQEALARRGIATAGLPPEEQAPGPPTSTEVMASRAQAEQQVKAAGLEGRIKLEDRSYRQGVLDLMIQHAHEEADYQAAVERGPHGFVPGALGFMTQMGAGVVDPLNIAAFSIPVLGEARWGMALAGAGDSLAARAGVRALQGGAQGFAGSTALVPADWWLHTQDGQDYTMADALQSVIWGAGLGAAAHGGFGAIGDVRARYTGRPLSGSLEDLRARALAGDSRAAQIVEKLGGAGTHVPAAALGDEGVALVDVPGLGTSLPKSSPEIEPEIGSALPPHPAEVYADLPPQAREDAHRATAAALIRGELPRTAQMLEEAAKEDPRIAESVAPIDAFHGSPHDFDAFSTERIGTGEGAQSYGHGLYFAEEQGVAESYRKDLTSDKRSRDLLAEQYFNNHGPNAEAALRKDAKAALSQAPDIGEEAAKFNSDNLLQAADLIKSGWKPGPKEGVTYRVRINADREHFLDWDKPLSEQSEHVKAALKKLKVDESAAPSGAEAYRHIGAYATTTLWKTLTKSPERGVENMPVLASKALRKAGIPGIKYLDQGSRGPSNAEIDAEIARVRASLRRRHEGAVEDDDGHVPLTPAVADYEIRRLEAQRNRPQTHNFVVFDDSLIRITHKNGQEVGLDDMKAARAADALPGPAPGTLRTGRPALDAVLAEPVVARAIQDGPVDRAHDVPYEAGASQGSDPTTHLDQRLPAIAQLPSGKSFPTAIPARIHEQVEKFVMERKIAAFRAEHGREPNARELNDIYETAHHEFAEPAEDAWYRSQGLDIDEVNAWWAKQDKITEHENPKSPPPDLYRKPYPHNVVEGVKHEEKGAAAEWPTEPIAGLAGFKNNLNIAPPVVAHSMVENAEGYKAAAKKRRERSAAGGGKVYDTTAARDRAHGMDPAEAKARHDAAGGALDAHLAAHGIGDDLPAEVRADAIEAMTRRGFDGDPAGALDYAMAKAEREALADADLQGMLDREVDTERASRHVLNTEDSDGDLHGDIPFDAGELPAQGGAAAAEAARETPAPGEGAREARQGAGQGRAASDRGVSPKANWEKFAGRPPEDPADVAASRAAEETPEPASVDAAKAPTAAEAAAAEAERLLADMLLTDEERAKVDEALKTLSQDSEAQLAAVREGAMCLMGAVA